MSSIEFSDFRLYPAVRRLEKNGVAVAIGGRALDILIALVANAGSVVSIQELMRFAWPETNGVEANLRVPMTALRRALGSDPAQYIASVSGRGYRSLHRRANSVRGRAASESGRHTASCAAVFSGARFGPRCRCDLHGREQSDRLLLAIQRRGRCHGWCAGRWWACEKSGAPDWACWTGHDLATSLSGRSLMIAARSGAPRN